MEYNYFLNAIKGYSPYHITAVDFPDNCAMTQIPSVFGLLIPNILEIIRHNINKFCTANEIMAICGLQLSFMPLTSDLPKVLKRVINDQRPEIHFCCNLHYLVAKTSESKKIKSWQGAKSLFIDFTAGEVMNDAEYINKLLYKNDVSGTTYGWLDPTLLNKIWQILASDEFRISSGINLSKHQNIN